MRRNKRISIVLFCILASAGLVVKAQSGRTYAVGLDWWGAGRGFVFPLSEEYDNPTGQVRIINSQGMLHPAGHPFFEALGTNGRACITCHQPAGAMSVSAERIRQRWTDTNGTDSIFAAIDGSNCPDLPQRDPKSHSLLLNRGLFRMVLPWPPKNIRPNFKLEVVRDPTGCNTGKSASISVFRRPRVAANFKFADQSVLMSDGREPSLRSQAITAALAHEEAAAIPTTGQLDRIVEFEMQVFAAQSAHIVGGLLFEQNGPADLGTENVAVGKAGLLNGERSPLSGFEVWKSPQAASRVEAFRASVARGSHLFDTGCSSCHMKSGSTRAMNIGTTNRSDAELPLFRITCDTGSVIFTADPGRGLATGKCADVGSVVMQQLRGLSARAPYFSNGSAQTLGDVVDFYDRRGSIGYSSGQKQDLVNFLSVL